MSGVVDPRHKPEKQVIAAETDQAFQRWFDRVFGNRKITEIKNCDHQPGQSKDRSRSARSHHHRVPPQAGEASPDAACGISQDIRPGIQDPLHQQAQVPQTPHVEKDVDDADVHIIRSQHAPGLRAQRIRAPVSSPVQQLFCVAAQWRNAGHNHGHKHQYIQSRQNSGRRKSKIPHGPRCCPGPWNSDCG
jgi:hypothetical protein